VKDLGVNLQNYLKNFLWTGDPNSGICPAGKPEEVRQTVWISHDLDARFGNPDIWVIRYCWTKARLSRHKR